MDVTLRDISPAGARITGSELVCLPHTFELRIHNGCGGYPARGAHLVWADGATAGLKFIE